MFVEWHDFSYAPASTRLPAAEQAERFSCRWRRRLLRDLLRRAKWVEDARRTPRISDWIEQMVTKER